MGTARPAPGLHRSTVKLTEHHSRVPGMPAIATARDERPLCPPATPAVPPPPAATPPAHCTAGNNAIMSWSVHLQVRVSSGISKCAGRYFGPGLPRPAGSHTAHTAPPPPSLRSSVEMQNIERVLPVVLARPSSHASVSPGRPQQA